MLSAKEKVYVNIEIFSRLNRFGKQDINQLTVSLLHFVHKLKRTSYLGGRKGRKKEGGIVRKRAKIILREKIALEISFCLYNQLKINKFPVEKGLLFSDILPCAL